MRTTPILTLIFAGLSIVHLQASEMTLGDGKTDAGLLAAYEFTWIQCTVQEESWMLMPALTESLEFPDSKTLFIRQSSTRPDGGASNVTMKFDSPTFAPLGLEALHTAGDGSVLAQSNYKITSDGYTGERVQGGEKQAVSGPINSTMYAGTTMGLPLATLPWQAEPLKFEASMLSFDGTYDVTATWVAREEMKSPEGTPFEAYLVDVHWHHRESGDIYAAGPDASGGRYWLVPEPPAGIPYVLRYKTDTYAVEFEREFCPE